MEIPDIGKMVDKMDIEGLIKTLMHKDNDISYKAVMALVRIGELAVERLI